MAGQGGQAGQLHIDDGSGVGAQTNVNSNNKEQDQLWQGDPDMPVGTCHRLSVIQKQHHDMHKKVYELERRIKELEK